MVSSSECSSGLTWHMFMHVVESKPTYPLWYLCSWCSYPTHASVQCYLRIMHGYDRCCSLAGRFSTYFLAFACTMQKYRLCIKILKPKLFQMSPLYLPICGIYLPFQVNLYVPNSKPSNKYHVLYARIAHVSTKAVLIFRVRRVILKGSGLRSSLTRKWLVTGMPSPMLCAN